MNGKKFTHEAVIIKPMSELIFLIQIQGNIRKAHVNQLKRIPQVPFTLKIRPDNSTPIHPNNTSPTLSTNSSDEEDNTKDSSADVEANNKESSTEESLSSADEETEPKQKDKPIRRSKRSKSSRHSSLNLKVLGKQK